MNWSRKVDRTSSPKQLDYWIVHGFSGGRLHSSGLRQELKAAGYIQARTMRTADIIITHSAGHRLLSDGVKAKIIMLVAPALPQASANQTYRKANIGMWREARTNKYLPRRVLWSIYSAGYLFFQPRRNHKLARLVKGGNHTFNPPESTQILVITNRVDPWPQSKLMRKFLSEEPWAFISLPGSHENIWESPRQYVAIINQYAKRLLA